MKLVTKNGNVFDCTFFVFTENVAFMRVLTSLVEAARVFSQKGETSTITCGGQEITGYTRVDALIQEENCIKVCLGKE